MTAAKNKIAFIATARCIGIVLVVFGHSFPFDVYISPALWTAQEFIYSFHMPLFIFLSGYLITRNSRSAGDYIRRRSIRLLIPYFVLSVITFIPKTLVRQFLNDSVQLSLWYLIKTELIPRENVWGHFWYIPVVYALCCAGVFLAKPLRRNRTAGWALLAASFLILFAPRTTDWFALEDLRKMLFYFILGMIASNQDPDARVVSNGCWLLAPLAAAGLFAVGNTVLTGSITACLMIGFVLHIGTRMPLEQHNLLTALEQNSFTVFLLSWPAQAVVEVVCNKLLHLPALLTMCVMFIAGIAVPLICVKIVSLIDKRISMKWLKLAIGM